MASRNPIKKFRLQYGIHLYTAIKGYKYEDAGIKIYPNGLVYLKEGLCSDGCSPTFDVPLLGIIGPWNGPVNRHTNLPITAKAFYLHDALLEVRRFTGMTTDEIHKAFCVEMMKTDFILRELYCLLATRYGPQA